MSKLIINFDEATFKGTIEYFDGNNKKPITLPEAITLLKVFTKKLQNVHKTGKGK